MSQPSVLALGIEAPRSPDLIRRISTAVVLVVDDAESMRKVLANQLRQMGVQRVLQAADGAEALKLLSAHPVTMVLSDWHMPGMDGLELLLRVRSHEKHWTLPFVMVTAEAQRERVMTAAQIGLSELLVKPFTSGRLIERFERALYWRPRADRPLDYETTVEALGLHLPSSEQQRPPVSEAAMPDAPVPTALSVQASVDPAQRPTVLVVDDTPDNLTLMSHLFRDLYRVKVVNNGAKAVALCQSDDAPDLVLLDVMMPGMDGFEVAHALRSHPTSEAIPVIFVTSLNDEASRLRGMSLGAVDFVSKPVQPDLLRVRVANFMRYIALQRNLQSDYDNILQHQRMRADADDRQRRALQPPLENALALLHALEQSAGLAPRALERLRQAGAEVGLVLQRLEDAVLMDRMSDDSVPVTLKEVSVAPLVRALLDDMQRRFVTRGIQWQLRLAPGLAEDGVLALADAALLKSALRQLLVQSAEAAAAGDLIQVTLWQRHAVRIEIDRPGEMTPEQLASYFEPPEQGRDGPDAMRFVRAQQGLMVAENVVARQMVRVVLSLPSAA